MNDYPWFKKLNKFRRLTCKIRPIWFAKSIIWFFVGIIIIPGVILNLFAILGNWFAWAYGKYTGDWYYYD